MPAPPKCCAAADHMFASMVLRNSSKHASGMSNTWCPVMLMVLNCHSELPSGVVRADRASGFHPASRRYAMVALCGPRICRQRLVAGIA
eukprot:2591450-Pyramimonas_sp.AAC.1